MNPVYTGWLLSLLTITDLRENLTVAIADECVLIIYSAWNKMLRIYDNSRYSRLFSKGRFDIPESVHAVIIKSPDYETSVDLWSDTIAMVWPFPHIPRLFNSFLNPFKDRINCLWFLGCRGYPKGIPRTGHPMTCTWPVWGIPGQQPRNRKQTVYSVFKWI